MSVSLADQYRLAVVQEDFRQRVASASFDQSVIVYTASPAPSGLTLQLAKHIIRQPDYAVDLFAWAVVSRPNVDINTLNDPANGDALILSTVASVYVTVAGTYPAEPP